MLSKKAVNMVIFAALVKHQSFSRAAASLGVSVSHISKTLAGLEQSLGVKLIERSTRNFTPTQAGLQFYESCTELVKAVEKGYTEIESMRDEVSGVFRLACMPNAGTALLIPALNDLKKQYPALEVEIVLTLDHSLDLLEEGIDLWITAGRSTSIDQGYVAQRLADNKLIVVASPDYLIRNKVPSHPNDLKDLNCLIYEKGNEIFDTWPFSKGGQSVNVNVKGNFMINSANALCDAAESGWGISLVPTFLIDDQFKDRKLIQVLSDWHVALDLPFYGIYPSRRYLPNKTKVVVEFIKEVLVKACNPDRLG
ncbi:LysR family transcriptional regulator [Vibrio caribbeanicus]|uniref:Transcriptional regulator n=1 Tax=Vibrio caribbeanicus ATCC BAA-2122 TaxID=796620 RepID=E3BI19_9VIBR|nr:LysR family transcriptional regulator [Vibrio caribbeanicus]EFP97458.1 transcriptional regulator [Vibrio caribbeanicus ATCC BAA-2122]